MYAHKAMGNMLASEHKMPELSTAVHVPELQSCIGGVCFCVCWRQDSSANLLGPIGDTPTNQPQAVPLKLGRTWDRTK